MRRLHVFLWRLCLNQGHQALSLDHSRNTHCNVEGVGVGSNQSHLPVVSSFTKTSDLFSLITGDYMTLAIVGSLMVPVVALALPYLGGLKLRTIDVGPFHTTLLSLVVGISGGFTLLYSVLTQPVISLLLHYVLLFMGVCWCFAIGCNLAADPANRQIARRASLEKSRPSFEILFLYIQGTEDPWHSSWTGFPPASRG